MDHYEPNRAKEAERQKQWMNDLSHTNKKKPITPAAEIFRLWWIIGLVALVIIIF